VVLWGVSRLGCCRSGNYDRFLYARKKALKKILLFALSALLAACENQEQKIDRELAWRDVKPPRDVDTHGVRIGDMTVPGHTQRVTFFLWGIAKEDYMDESDEPQIIGEMDLDAWIHDTKDLEDLKALAELDKVALAAYNHGSVRVVLTKHKAYAVTSDEEEDLAAEARRAQ
jgi:hypothetical protein